MSCSVPNCPRKNDTHSTVVGATQVCKWCARYIHYHALRIIKNKQHWLRYTNRVAYQRARIGALSDDVGALTKIKATTRKKKARKKAA